MIRYVVCKRKEGRSQVIAYQYSLRLTDHASIHLGGLTGRPWSLTSVESIARTCGPRIASDGDKNMHHFVGSSSVHRRPGS
jgi:hypothetical protein